MTGECNPGGPGARAEVPGGQGVQIGSYNKQVNQFIENYVETQVVQAPPAPVPGSRSAWNVDQQRSRLTGEQALQQHWDPRSRGVERAARPGWFFTGRRQALSEIAAWLIAAPAPADNVRVVTGGPGSGKSAVLARLVTISNPRYRAEMPEPLALEDPVAVLPPNIIDIAVHARAAPTDEIIQALAAKAIGRQADLDGLIDGLLDGRDAFCIVVDALDEADDPLALAVALRRLASESADAGARLLVGTRPGGPDRRLITALGLPARDGAPGLIDLDDRHYLSRDDLVEYVRRRLLLTGVPPIPGRPDTPYRDKETLAHQVAYAVAQAAYPAFLIGQLVSRSLLLRHEPISPGDPGWQNFPTTVAEAMDRYLASVGSQSEQDRVEDLLRPLAYARGDGLPLDDDGLWPRLVTVLARPGRRYTLSDIASLLDTAADYLIETVITGRSAYFRLYHQALSDRLRDRDQQHPRPVSAAQTIYQCLLDTVAANPDGTHNWPAAHPYLRSQLAGYAADAGQLGGLLEDPGFLVFADPAELFGALQRYGQVPTGNAEIYRLAYAHLSRGADMAGERASYLQLAARRYQAQLADHFGRLPLDQPWTTRWIRGRRPHPHYIAGRHDDIVNAMAVTELHGRAVIVSGDDDGVVMVWDLESGEPVLGPLTGHDGVVHAVAVGERHGQVVIVSGSSDETVRVWSLESGEPVLGPLTGHESGVNAVAVGERRGRQVIVSGGDDQAVRVWDLESGQPVLGPLTGHEYEVSAVAVGERNGRPVIVSGSYDQTVQVWDLESGQLVLGPLTGHEYSVSGVAVGERYGRPVIVSGSYDRTVRVWDLESGELVLAPLTGHGHDIYTVGVGEYRGRPVIVSGSADRTIRVWDLESGEPVLDPLTGHDGGVDVVAVSKWRDRQVIVSGSDDETVRVWNLDLQMPPLSPLISHDGGVNAVAIGSRHGRLVVVSGGYDRTVRVWDLDSGEPVLGPLSGHNDPVHAVTVTWRYGRPVVVSASEDRTIRVWDLDSGEPVLDPLTGHDDAIYALAVSERHGRPVIVSGSDDETVRVWDLDSGEPVLGPLTGHEGRVSAVAIGKRHGRLVVVSGSLDETVRVWDLDSGEPALGPLTSPGGAVYAVAVTERQGRSVIISGVVDGKIQAWDLESGQPVLGPLTGHEGSAYTLTVAERQGRPVIISGSDDDRTIQVWEMDVQRPAILRIELDHQPMSVTSNASQLVIGTTGELLRIDLS